MNTAYLQTIASDYNNFIYRCRCGFLFMLGGGIVLGFLIYKLLEQTVSTAIDIWNDYLSEYFEIVGILFQDAWLVFVEEVMPISRGELSVGQLIELNHKAADLMINKIVDADYTYYKSDEFRAEAQSLVAEYDQEDLTVMANGSDWDNDHVVYAAKNYETLSADHYGDGLLSLPCKYVGSSTLTPYILGERV